MYFNQDWVAEYLGLTVASNQKNVPFVTSSLKKIKTLAEAKCG